MNFDIIIIGGGPAGCSSAIMLQQYGYKVAIFEKDSFPKHNLGESLLPIVNSDYMKVIGLDEDIKQAGFPKKYGTTFVWGNNRKPWSLFFDKRLESEQLHYSKEESDNILGGDYTHSYQVNRYHFDNLFVKKAKSLGIEFFENAKVQTISMTDKNIEKIILMDGTEATAKFYVDASGQVAKIANQLGERKFNKDLGFSATYGYFKDCKFKDDFISKNTQLIVSIDIGWIWFIYIGNGITSIGLVTEEKNITKDDFFNKLYSTEEIAPLIKNAEFVNSLGEKTDDVYKIRNRSYFNDSIYGQNYLLVGDAAGFVDPILSGGLSLALMSGITSSVYIDSYLQNGDESKLKEYQKIIFKDVENYYNLAKYWYGNNKSTDSWFWHAKSILGYDITNTYNKRAFTFLASGGYYNKKNFENFNELRIENHAYNFEDVNEIQHLFSNNIEHGNIKKLFQNLYSNKNNEEYIEAVKKLWLQVQIIKKTLSKIDDNFSKLFTFALNTIGKIPLFEYVFSDKNFPLFSQLQTIQTDQINQLTQELFYLILFYWKQDKIILNDLSINIDVLMGYKLENGVYMSFNDEKDIEEAKSIQFQNNQLFIDKKEITKTELKCNLDNFIG